MTLRTPRRRISPRTRLRYRAIREFFRRALGSTSHQNIKINSSIAVNVTDLKRKIVGLEQQLDEVSKHCRDIVSLDQSRRDSEDISQIELKQDIGKLNESFSERKSNGKETELVYKSDRCYKTSEDNDFTPKPKNETIIKETEPAMATIEGHVSKSKLHKISHTETKLHKYKTRSVHDNSPLIYSTSSFHSLTSARMINSVYRHSNDTKKQFKEETRNDLTPSSHKSHKHSGHSKYFMGDHLKNYYEDKSREKMRKPKRMAREIDSEFIADIIRRQYKPVKLFSKRETDLSQFSAPVCRDQDIVVAESPKVDSELCSCLHGEVSPCKHLKPRRYDLNVMQSVCDTRLYSSKKHVRAKHRKMTIDDAHSNSDMYDLVPVKERSSPKSRKKFVEDSSDPYEFYKEVPPSPRTLRPRLNLKAQYYTDHEDYMAQNKHQLKRHSPKPQQCYLDYSEQLESDDNIASNSPTAMPEKNTVQSKHLKCTLLPIEEKTAQPDEDPLEDTLNDFPYDDFPEFVNEQTSIAIDTPLNKTQGTEIPVDKTDKALTEIKDILQSFLHEIKKETVVSQCDKSDITCKTAEENNILPDPVPNIPPNVIPNSTSFNSHNVGQCAIPPIIAPFSNPCCYQVLPMCPLNCSLPVPNGYVMPSQSYTCTNCVKTPKETNSNHCCNKSPEVPYHTETDELIKEIYKFVAQGPPRNQEEEVNEVPPEPKTDSTKPLTSRSVGGSNKFCKQDANVGTQPLKCYSKSCEAIWSKLIPDAYMTEINESYSDSLLEKLSVEIAPQSVSETEMDSTPTETEKNKGFGGLAKVLRSFGLFKKKKKEIIEETSESESVTNNIELIPNQPPFRQNVTNYMMYGQEYFQPPNIYPRPHEYLPPHDYQRLPPEYNPRWHDYPRGRHEYPPDYMMHRVPSSELCDPYAQRYNPQIHEHRPDYARNSKRRPTAPPYSSSYDTSYSQVQPGLCLKEIEVKSTGTQSERRISIFKKMKNKMKQPINEKQRPSPRVAFSCPCNQPCDQVQSSKPNKQPFWKGFQVKAVETFQNDINYGAKTREELMAGDQTIRKALLKKLFNKRNPFSPRNAIVKTLLGKDKNVMEELTMKSLKRPKLFM